MINRLHQVLRPFLLRRLKSEVESQLPGKAEYVVKCELSAMQKVLYRQIQEQGLCSVGDGGELRVSGLNNVEMQLRKVCNHPFLFFSDEQMDQTRRSAPLHICRASGKFELLDRILPKLKALGHRVLIFSQMVQLMNLLEDYLGLRGFTHLRLDGHTKGDDRGELLRLFNEPGSAYFAFLLSTRAGGLGLNLQSADTVILFDSDWNPQMDLQAMARAHRIGQTQEVRVLRLVTASPIEEKILATANEKLDAEAKIIEAGKFNQTSNASERREMLQRLLAQSADEPEEGGIPEDEDVNQMMARPNPALGLSREQELERMRQLDEARLREPRGRDAAGAGSGGLLALDELPPWLAQTEVLLQARARGGPRRRRGGEGREGRGGGAAKERKGGCEWMGCPARRSAPDARARQERRDRRDEDAQPVLGPRERKPALASDDRPLPSRSRPRGGDDGAGRKRPSSTPPPDELAAVRLRLAGAE